MSCLALIIDPSSCGLIAVDTSVGHDGALDLLQNVSTFVH